MATATLPSKSSRIRSPTGVPPGSRVWHTAKPSQRSDSASKRTCVLLPAPSGPSNVRKSPSTSLLDPLPVDLDPAIGLAALTARPEVVAIGELVLQFSDVRSLW